MSNELVTTPGLGQKAVQSKGRQSPQKKKRLNSKQSRYLAYSVVLEEAGGPRLMRLTMLTVTLVVGAFLFWTWITPIKEVARSQGEVLPSSSIQMIQHLEGGIVSEVLIKDGDMVADGQVLMRLEPTGSISELQQVRARKDTLSLQMERLRAFTENRDPDFSTVDGLADVKSDQMLILTQQRASLESQRAIFDSQLAQKNQEIILLNKQETEVRAEIALLEDELGMRQTLFEKGLDSRIRVLSAQRELNRAQSDMTQVRGARSKANEELLEIEQRVLELEDRMRKDALTELGSLGTELSQVRETMSRLEDRVERLDIIAPTAGRVNNLIFSSAGGVIPPGAVIMEVVPDNNSMIVESRIDPRDIGHLVVGQDVVVKVTTYDFSRYGSIDGTLAALSPTTFADPDSGLSYYVARIELSQNYVGDNPMVNLLSAGMTVQADINTGEKTLFQYLLKPIYKTMSESFTER